MRSLARGLGGVVAAMALAIGAAPAQLNNLLSHNVNNDTTNAFGCSTSCVTSPVGEGEKRCNVFHRLWADLKPSQVNLVAQPITACDKDGFPRYAPLPMRLVGDVHTSRNYVDSEQNEDACEAWMSAWDAILKPEEPTFISFYGTASSLMNFGERGNPFCPNCLLSTDPDYGTTCNTEGAPIQSVTLCFGALGIIGQPASPAAGGVVATGATAADNSPGTPLGNDADADGNLDTRGGLEPVPVPRVTSHDVVGRAVTVAWDAADNEVLVNRPGTIPCPAGATFVDETSRTTSPPAIAGVRLFLHRRLASDPGLTLAGLENSTVTGGVLGAFGNAADAVAQGFCSTDAAGILPGIPCPLSHIVPCNAPGVTGGACAPNGTDFMSQPQSVTLSEAAAGAALGADGPIGEGQVGVLNTKIVYSGATETYSAAGQEFLNPRLVSLFSASSTPFSFEGPASGVQFDSSATVVRGNQVTLSWTTVGGPFTSFTLSRALDGVSFEEVAVIPGGAAPTYTFTDEIRGRASASIWYRLVYTDVGGGAGQALTEVSLRSGGQR